MLILGQRAFEYFDPGRFYHLQFRDRQFVTGLGLGALALCVAVVLFGRRSVAISAAVVCIALVPSGQKFVIGGLDLQFLRILGILLVARVFLGGQAIGIRWSWLDLAFAAYMTLPIVAVVIRGETGSLPNRITLAFDSLAFYVAGRWALRGVADWNVLVMTLAVLAVPIGAAFAYEKATAHNLFAFLGGVPEETALRQGKLRAQGPFSHPILAGCWWASVVPLMLAVWRIAAPGSLARLIVGLGLPLAVALVFATASSTPIGGVVIGVIVFYLYRWRTYWPKIRMWVLASALLVHFATKSGLHGLLFTRVTLVSGSTGYHRFLLFDQALKRVGEWMLAGGSTYHWGWGMDDVTSQWVAAGVIGGLACLASLIAVMIGVARMLQRAAMDPRLSEPDRMLAWGVLASVVVHMMSFLGVTYFGQIVGLFSIVIGGGCTLSQESKRTRGSEAGMRATGSSGWTHQGRVGAAVGSPLLGRGAAHQA